MVATGTMNAVEDDMTRSNKSTVRVNKSAVFQAIITTKPRDFDAPEAEVWSRHNDFDARGKSQFVVDRLKAKLETIGPVPFRVLVLQESNKTFWSYADLLAFEAELEAKR